MTNINPINFGYIQNNYKIKSSDEEQKKDSQYTQDNNKPKKQMGSDEILGYLAATNSDLVPKNVKKTVDVEKYVNNEQYARMEEFMKGFESDYDEAMNVALNEFPDISQKTAGNIALAYINATY